MYFEINGYLFCIILEIKDGLIKFHSLTEFQVILGFQSVHYYCIL
jgi:uncharacterized membrane protein